MCLQNVIARMAANSTSCKTWCITVISAVVVFAYETTKPDAVVISILPLSLFFLLDAYYLGLERQLRDMYNSFIHKVHSGSIKVDDLFILTPRTGAKALLASTTQAVISFSVWPFYGLIAAMLVVLRTWIF